MNLDIDALTKWLTNSVPGIVVLGALGSGLFALVAWSVKRLVLNWFPELGRALYKRIDRFVQRQIDDEDHLEQDLKTFAITLYFAYHVLVGLLSSIVVAGLLLTYSERFYKLESANSLAPRLAIIFFAGVLFVLALRSILRIVLPYYYWFHSNRSQLFKAPPNSVPPSAE